MTKDSEAADQDAPAALGDDGVKPCASVATQPSLNSTDETAPAPSEGANTPDAERHAPLDEATLKLGGAGDTGRAVSPESEDGGQLPRSLDEVPPAADGDSPVPPESSVLDRLGRKPALLLLAVIGPLFVFVALLMVVASPKKSTETGAVRVVDAVDAGAALADAAPILPAGFLPHFRVADLAADESIKIVEQKLGHQTFLVALRHAGVGRKGAQRILDAFKGVRSFDRLRERDVFRVALDKESNEVKAFELETSLTDVWQVRDVSGSFVGEKIAFVVEKRRIAKALVVKDDLKTALTTAELDPALLDRIEDALEGHVDAVAARPGTRFRLLVGETYLDGRLVGKPDLDAVEYWPPKANAAALRFYRSPSRGDHGFYDAKGQQPYSGGFRAPVPFAHITSRFNPRRMHPVLHVIKPHNGIDFAASVGTPVYATAPGTIKFAADSGACGNMVQIQHEHDLITSYCHLSRFAKVKVGQHVEGRQLLGFAGATGRATGPHLHFAAKRAGKFIDPATLNMDGVRTVANADRDTFESNMRAWNDELDALALPSLPSDLPETHDEESPSEDLDQDGNEYDSDAGPAP